MSGGKEEGRMKKKEIEKLKKEFADKFVNNVFGYPKAEELWSWFESKLDEIRQD